MGTHEAAVRLNAHSSNLLRFVTLYRALEKLVSLDDYQKCLVEEVKGVQERIDELKT